MEQRQNPLILTIDDEENIRDSFRLFLEDFEYNVIEAANGREGIDIIQKQKPDLVLCDLRMPDVDGLQVLQFIKENTPDIPIIVVSGTGVIGDAIEAIRHGAWNYLLKPIQDMSVLLHAISQALERSRLIVENRAYQEHLEEEVGRRTEALQKTMRDLNHSHRKSKENEEKYRLIFENLQDVYFEILLDGTLYEISPSISHFSLYQREEILGNNIAGIFPSTQSRDRLMSLLRREETVTDYEIYLRDKDSTLIPCSLNARYRETQGRGPDKICGTLRDITERKQAEARIEYLAYFDALTELPNRRLLLDRLEQNISRAHRHNHYGAMLFLDLDRFKNINDSLGHPVGDALLKEVAKRLTIDLRAEDTVSRLGGDEFVMLLSDLGPEPVDAATVAQQKAEAIQRRLAEKYQIAEHILHITPSIGVAMFPTGEEGHETGDDILRYADTAMYRAKDDGRDTIRFFLPSMQSAADERLAIEKELRYAMEKNQLSLFFQPQVDTLGNIVGAETLIRWKHPQKGFISPATFIPVAEATGLILPIGEWVLHSACEYLKTWEDSGLQIHHLAVNVSPRQFRQPDFVRQVCAILEDTGANPKLLGLELTEGMVIDNVIDTIEKMRALKQLGIELSIDDFGTGYSSLAYLQQMPLDILKIDQSFVRDIASDANDVVIVDTIISMANHLELKVIPEGVETELELACLAEKGCKLYQGYHFSRPVPDSQFTEQLRAGTVFS